jgi:competence protein ComEC
MDSNLHVAFLDVGQGDAILIRTPSHQSVLIDGGPSPSRLNVELGKRLPFWDHKIDLVISTQPHSDHVSGLVDMVRRYDIQSIVGCSAEYDSSTYNEWRSLIEDDGIEYSSACAGQRIILDKDVHLDIINPQRQTVAGTSSDVDNNGVVLRLIHDQISFLFTADIRHETERLLIDLGYLLKSDVLKVAHHGSNTSSTTEFITAVNPSLAVISVGEDNRFSHPDDGVLSRLEGIKVMRTDKHGTVELITDGQTLWIK